MGPETKWPTLQHRGLGGSGRVRERRIEKSLLRHGKPTGLKFVLTSIPSAQPPFRRFSSWTDQNETHSSQFLDISVLCLVFRPSQIRAFSGFVCSSSSRTHYQLYLLTRLLALLQKMNYNARSHHDCFGEKTRRPRQTLRKYITAIDKIGRRAMPLS